MPLVETIRTHVFAAERIHADDWSPAAGSYPLCWAMAVDGRIESF
jgi:hypothetical protein